MKVNVNTSKKKTEDASVMTPKGTAFLLLKTLYKNEACLEAKRLPWYVAALFFVFAIGISIIPPVTTSATEKGSYILTNATYSMDAGLESFTHFLLGDATVTEGTTTYPDSIDLVIRRDQNEDGTYTTPSLRFENNSAGKWNAATNLYTASLTADDGTISTKAHHYFEYKRNVSLDGRDQEVARLRVFVELGEADSVTGLTPAYDFFFNDPVFGIKGTTTPEADGYIPPASLMVLGSHEIFIAVYNTKAETNTQYAGSPFRGDYLKNVSDDGVNLKALLTSKDVSQTVNDDGSYTLVAPTESKWVTFLNNAYSTTRMSNTLTIFYLLTGMNAFVVLIFGFTLWLMTRGKRNPYRTLKVNDTMKMSCYAALSPALLTLIVGFIMPSIATFVFVGLTTLRLMWLSMRTLRPIE